MNTRRHVVKPVVAAEGEPLGERRREGEGGGGGKTSAAAAAAAAIAGRGRKAKQRGVRGGSREWKTAGGPGRDHRVLMEVELEKVHMTCKCPCT